MLRRQGLRRRIVTGCNRATCRCVGRFAGMGRALLTCARLSRRSGSGTMPTPPPTTFDARTAGLVAAAKRQWERTFDAIIEPLMVVDDDFVVRRANLALADDLSTAVQRLVGRRCHETRRESPRVVRRARRVSRATAARCRRRARATALREGELRTAAERVYRLRAYPFEDEAGERLTVCSYRDVTEERQLSRQLISAEKLASIGRLAAGRGPRDQQPAGRHPGLHADPDEGAAAGRGGSPPVPGGDRAQCPALQGGRRVAAAVLAAESQRSGRRRCR